MKTSELSYCEWPYFSDGAECFAHFSELPYAVFLDGGQPFRQQERYQIMSAEPLQTITAHSDNFLSIDIYSEVKKELECLKRVVLIPNAIAHLAFKIGAIGYISYDYSRGYYTLPGHAISDISLPYAIFGIYDWSIVIDHHEKKTWLIAQSQTQLEWIKEQLSHPPLSNPSFQITRPFKSNISFEQYTDSFSKIKYHIRQGDCYQVNLCQRFNAPYEGSTWLAYQQLRQKNPTPFSAYLKFDHYVLLSLSPERFLKVKNQWVETKPIKGTIARFEDPDLDQKAAQLLLNSEKDKTENIMIVDLLRNDLGKCCKPGSIRVPQLAKLESFPNVHHLVSTIVGKLQEDQHALDLLKHCFPGGSITGAPKLRAMQIIDTLEHHRRSAYCGTISYVDVTGDMDSQITIRTFISDSEQLYCYAGGAIVADSQVESEYEECHIKIKRLIDTLSR